MVKGSGRSIEPYHMFRELTKVRDLLPKFGGHPMAAGLSWARRGAPPGEDLARYLAGETLEVDAGLTGWCRVETAGCPLGLGKGVNGTLKNHLSKGLRLR